MQMGLVSSVSRTNPHSRISRAWAREERPERAFNYETLAKLTDQTMDTVRKHWRATSPHLSRSRNVNDAAFRRAFSGFRT